MAARKLSPGPKPSHPELDRLRERTRELVATDDQLKAQRVSFVYGNAPMDSKITKETALIASTRFRIKED
jgi:hypothetical protein